MIEQEDIQSIRPTLQDRGTQFHTAIKLTNGDWYCSCRLKYEGGLGG